MKCRTNNHFVRDHFKKRHYPVYCRAIRREIPASGTVPGKKTAKPLWSFGAMAMFLLAFFMLGQCIAGSYLGYRDKNIFHLLRDSPLTCDTVEAAGRITTHPCCRYGNLDFLMEVNILSLKAGKEELLAIDGLRDPVEIRVRDGKDGWFQRDDYVRLQGVMDFSGDYGDVSLASGTGIMPILKTDNYNIETIENSCLTQKFYDTRHRIYNCLSFTYRENLGWMKAAMAEALILGNKNNIPDRILEDFKKSGILHMLAVSGLHITFFILIIYYLFFGFTGKPDTSALFIFIALVSLAAYNFLLGGKASALRATIFIILMFTAKIWGRPNSGRILLCFSFLILLVFCPGFFFDRGFWLSFSAMSGIVIINPLIHRAAAMMPLFKKISRGYVFRVFFISFSVQLMIFPQLLYYYGEAALAGIFSNILVLPVFYILLSVLMISSAAAVLHPSCGGAIMILSTPFPGIINRIAGYTASLDFLIFKDISITPAILVAYYIALAAAVLIVRYIFNPRSRD